MGAELLHWLIVLTVRWGLCFNAGKFRNYGGLWFRATACAELNSREFLCPHCSLLEEESTWISHLHSHGQGLIPSPRQGHCPLLHLWYYFPFFPSLTERFTQNIKNPFSRTPVSPWAALCQRIPWSRSWFPQNPRPHPALSCLLLLPFLLPETFPSCSDLLFSF